MNEILGNSNFLELNHVQDMYNIIITALEVTTQKFGTTEIRTTTNDKFSNDTKNLIIKRTELKTKRNKTVAERVELSILNELVRNRIQADIKNHDDRLIKEVNEETWSTKKVRTALSTGTKIMPKLCKNDGSVTHDRDTIINVGSY